MRTSREAANLLRGRIAIAALISAVAFSVVAARLVDVMVLSSTVRRESSVTPVVKRADIVDRNGALIARDLPVTDLYATPAVFWDPAGAARQLAGATGADEARLKTAFAPKKGYILVQRGLTPEQ